MRVFLSYEDLRGLVEGRPAGDLAMRLLPRLSRPDPSVPAARVAGRDPLSRVAGGALAGGVAATCWAVQQPLDKRVFGTRYDDVELLGKLVTRGTGVAGRRARDARGQRRGVRGHLRAACGRGCRARRVAIAFAAAMAENFGFWPLGA